MTMKSINKITDTIKPPVIIGSTSVPQTISIFFLHAKAHQIIDLISTTSEVSAASATTLPICQSYAQVTTNPNESDSNATPTFNSTSSSQSTTNLAAMNSWIDPLLEMSSKKNTELAQGHHNTKN